MNKILIKIKDYLKELKPKPLTRSWKYGINAVVSVILVLGIILFLDIFSYRHSKEYDLTSDKRFSLSPQTISILESIEGDIKAVAFFSTEDPLKEYVSDLLDRYKYESDGTFQYRFVDPALRPSDAKEYNVEVYNTIVLIYGDRTERVTLSEDEIFESGEQKLTNAILRVMATEQKHIYFLTQHGEHGIDDDYNTVKSSLEGQNYKIFELNLVTTPEVPEDAAVLIMAGPVANLFDVEIKSIRDYLSGGGSVLVMLDPDAKSPRLESFLEEIGIVMGRDIIIDTRSRLYGGDYTIPMVNIYYPHTITEDFKLPSFFPYARSVEIDEGASDSTGWDLKYLAKTSEYSWAETDLSGGAVKFDEGRDKVGPVPVAAVGVKDVSGEDVEETDEENVVGGEARIVVFGNSEFANNTFFYVEGNRELFLNSVNWLAEELELIAIGPKDKKTDILTMSRGQAIWFFMVSVIIMPLLMVCSGVIVTLRRRWRD